MPDMKHLLKLAVALLSVVSLAGSSVAMPQSPPQIDCDALCEEIAMLQQQKQDTEDLVRMAEAAIDALEELLDEAKQELAALQAALEQAEKEAEDACANGTPEECAAARMKVAEAKRKVEDAQALVDSREELLAAARRQLAITKTILASLCSRLERAQKLKEENCG